LMESMAVGSNSTFGPNVGISLVSGVTKVSDTPEETSNDAVSQGADVVLGAIGNPGASMTDLTSALTARDNLGLAGGEDDEPIPQDNALKTQNVLTEFSSTLVNEFTEGEAFSISSDTSETAISKVNSDLLEGTFRRFRRRLASDDAGFANMNLSMIANQVPAAATLIQDDSTNVFGKSVDQNVSSDALTINLNEQFRTINEFWDDLGAPDTVSSVQFVVQFTDSANSGNSREELIEIFDAILFLKKWSLFQNDTFAEEQSQIYNITSFEEVSIPETLSANDLDVWLSNRDDYEYYDVIEDALLEFLLKIFGEFIDEELAKGGTNSKATALDVDPCEPLQIGTVGEINAALTPSEIRKKARSSYKYGGKAEPSSSQSYTIFDEVTQ